MALARTYAVALAGVHGHVVEVEADIENGLVALMLVGLPDTALREARDRIRSAIVNSRQSWPMRRITVGPSPARSCRSCGTARLPTRPAPGNLVELVQTHVRDNTWSPFRQRHESLASTELVR